MLFNSIDFLLFFPVALIVYYLCPKRFRYIWLLGCSYYFYMGWHPAYALLLLASTAITYSCGYVLEYVKNTAWPENKKKRHKKFWLWLSIAANLGMLCYFKYMGFFTGIVVKIAAKAGIAVNLPELNILLPVGISFYIFQALGYAIDVYREDIYAEKNFLKYALFVSFFPQLVAGPIERSKNLLVQLNTPHPFRLDELVKGVVLIAYGLFLKMVIADRAAIVVNTVFNDWRNYPGLYIVFATALFAVQIYCDFYGYSTIARGAALTMGITLIDNFEAPYFSRSIKEFWRRWHISLSGWFRDYVYIPLGGNRKGVVRKDINLMITFFLSGLWHGAGISYIVWGLLNGGYQVAADIRDAAFGALKSRLGLQGKARQYTAGKAVWQRLVAFALVCYTWLFFRAASMLEALRMTKSVLTNFNWWIIMDGSLYDLGVNRQYFGVLMLALAVLLIIDYQKYRGISMLDRFFAQNVLLQAVLFTVLVTMIVLFGCYGRMYNASQFIYFQF